MLFVRMTQIRKINQDMECFTNTNLFFFDDLLEQIRQMITSNKKQVVPPNAYVNCL